MSRIRTIKPDSSLSETLESVSILGALLFARLPCFADDEGRMRYSPALIKAQIFPLRDEITREDCGKAIEELATEKLVHVYTVEGSKYLSICGFKEHQKVNRPQASQLPAPPVSVCTDGDVHEPINEESMNSHGEVTESDENGGGTGETDGFSEHSVNTHCWKGKERKRNGKGKGNGKGMERRADDSDDVFDESQQGQPSFALRCYAAFQTVTGKAVGNIPRDIEDCLNDFAEEYTISEVEAMIRLKQSQWQDKPELAKWIRPETLFARRHFKDYMEESKNGGDINAEDGRFDEYDD